MAHAGYNRPRWLPYGTYTALLMHSKEKGMFRKQKQWKLTSLVASAG